MTEAASIGVMAALCVLAVAANVFLVARRFRRRPAPRYTPIPLEDTDPRQYRSTRPEAAAPAPARPASRSFGHQRADVTAAVTVLPDDRIEPIGGGMPVAFPESETTGLPALVFLSASARTDKGLMRITNEDAILIDAGNVFAVADGMGGHAHGALASRKALDAFGEAMKSPDPAGEIADLPTRASHVVQATRLAHEAVRELAAGGDPMGTTIVATRFVPTKAQIYIVNVGDSRCYRIRRGAVALLTQDHTEVVEQGRRRGRLTRALGMQERVLVDLYMDIVMVRDVYLLCSDGFWSHVSEERMLELVAGKGHIEEIVRRLVAEAVCSGASDDISVLVVRVDEAN